MAVHFFEELLELGELGFSPFKIQVANNYFLVKLADRRSDG